MNYKNILTDAVISNEDYQKLPSWRKHGYKPCEENSTPTHTMEDDDDNGFVETAIEAAMLSSMGDNDDNSNDFQTADNSDNQSDSSDNFGGFGGGDSGGGGADNSDSSSLDSW